MSQVEMYQPYRELGGPIGRLIDGVAAIKVSMHAKLLAGFLTGALLLLAMAIVSLIVINRMGQQVAQLNQLHQNVDRARQMEYSVTGQSHFRAMALLSRDDANNPKIANAKSSFIENLGRVETASGPEQKEFFSRVREANDRFGASSAKVLSLYLGGNIPEAMKVHLEEEHPISHELEAFMRELVSKSRGDMETATAAFQADRGLLTTMVAGFSLVSLFTALFLGFLLSWSFIRPVRRIQSVLNGVTRGDFSQRVEVPNRDEFGGLSQNLNTMTQELGRVYAELRDLNENLQVKVNEQVQELEHASALKRYLSPQIAESILSGERDVQLVSTRKNLTVLFSDIRGFTPLSERMESEELIELLNQYLSEMTDIVFKHGGTLDKYIGDAIMAFFGDPVPYEDHPVRAVRVALEMQAKLAELRERWLMEREEQISIGIGIVTGYVTVGNIGSQARMDYTVMGNNVNLASRLADSAAPGQVLVSERTLAQVRDLVDAKQVDEIELEGVSRPIRIYEITGKDGGLPRA